MIAFHGDSTAYRAANQLDSFLTGAPYVGYQHVVGYQHLVVNGGVDLSNATLTGGLWCAAALALDGAGWRGEGRRSSVARISPRVCCVGIHRWRGRQLAAGCLLQLEQDCMDLSATPVVP